MYNKNDVTCDNKYNVARQPVIESWKPRMQDCFIFRVDLLANYTHFRRRIFTLSCVNYLTMYQQSSKYWKYEISMVLGEGKAEAQNYRVDQ